MTNLIPVHNNGQMESTFESAMEGLGSTGASKDTRDLVEMLARHGEEEGAILSRYQRFAEDASAPERATSSSSSLTMSDDTMVFLSRWPTPSPGA